MRRVCNFLNIDYQNVITKGGGFQPSPYTTGQHALIGSPPDARRLDAWKERLSSRDIEIFESIATGALLHLGYLPRYGLRARRTTLKEGMMTIAREGYRHCVNRVRYYRRFKGIEGK